MNMTGSNGTDLETDQDIDEKSLITLAQQAPQHLLWIISSPLAFVSNLLVVLTISLNKQIQNKSQFIILSHTVGELIYSLSQFVTGMVRYLAHALSRPETSNQFVCILKVLPLHFTAMLVKLFTIALAFDRFLCVGLPLFYKKLRTSGYLVTVNALCWGYCILRLPFGFASYDRSKIFPVCGFATSFDAGYVAYGSIEANLVMVLTIAPYLLATCILWQRYRSAKFVGESQRSEWRRQMDLDAFVAILIIGSISFGTSIAQSVVNSIAAKYRSLEVTTKLAPVNSLFTLINGTSHFFVYLILLRSFRKAFLRVICKQTAVSNSNVVVPMSQHPSVMRVIPTGNIQAVRDRTSQF